MAVCFPNFDRWGLRPCCDAAVMLFGLCSMPLSETVGVCCGVESSVTTRDDEGAAQLGTKTTVESSVTARGRRDRAQLRTICRAPYAVRPPCSCRAYACTVVTLPCANVPSKSGRCRKSLPEWPPLSPSKPESLARGRNGINAFLPLVSCVSSSLIMLLAPLVRGAGPRSGTEG